MFKPIKTAELPFHPSSALLGETSWGAQELLDVYDFKRPVPRPQLTSFNPVDYRGYLQQKGVAGDRGFASKALFEGLPRQRTLYFAQGPNGDRRSFSISNEPLPKPTPLHFEKASVVMGFNQATMDLAVRHKATYLVLADRAAAPLRVYEYFFRPLLFICSTREVFCDIALKLDTSALEQAITTLKSHPNKELRQVFFLENYLNRLLTCAPEERTLRRISSDARYGNAQLLLQRYAGPTASDASPWDSFLASEEAYQHLRGLFMNNRVFYMKTDCYDLKCYTLLKPLLHAHPDEAFVLNLTNILYCWHRSDSIEENLATRQKLVANVAHCSGRSAVTVHYCEGKGNIERPHVHFVEKYHGGAEQPAARDIDLDFDLAFADTMTPSVSPPIADPWMNIADLGGKLLGADDELSVNDSDVVYQQLLGYLRSGTPLIQRAAANIIAKCAMDSTIPLDECQFRSLVASLAQLKESPMAQACLLHVYEILPQRVASLALYKSRLPRKVRTLLEA